MKVLLLANVGNHDLQLLDRSLLPEKNDDARWWQPRRLGEAIRDDFKRYRDAIDLPLLMPTMRWLKDHEAVDIKSDLTVHLFASDQDRALTNESEWLKDTAPLAEVIRDYFNYHWEMKKSAVQIHRIDGSPADYANTLRFYQETLPGIRERTGECRVYMEVSGGTPAMTSMLIVMGAETFGQDVVTLYMDRDSHQPYEIAVAQALFTRKTREALNEQISLYAYNAAFQTVDQSGRLLTPDENKRELLRCLLRYADRRLAFDFKRARSELESAYALATGQLQAQVKFWMRELNQPQSSTQLAELIHSARIKLKLGDYADFTQRLFRFQEALFRCMAERMGLEYGKSDEYASETWAKNQPALVDYLRTYSRTATGQINPVDLKRSLNRYSLGAIVDFYLQDAAWAHWRAPAELAFKMSAVVELRNKGISGHGFDGISLDDLETTYGRPADSIVHDMQQAYTAVFEVELSASPYDRVNELIRELITP